MVPTSVAFISKIPASPCSPRYTARLPKPKKVYPERAGIAANSLNAVGQ